MKNKNYSLHNLISVILTALLLVSCGGGGGGSGSSDGGSISGDVYLVQAAVTKNGCGERIANVTQEFTVNSGGSSAIVDTSIVKATGTSSGDSLQAGFSETNGGCTRNYTIEMSGLNGTGNVKLTSETQCTDGQTCTNSWEGTATRTGSKVLTTSDEGGEKVRGESCIPPVSDVGYRPSLFECNGAAGVLMRNNLRNNYSVVVRRNGQFNDRDPNNPSCGTNRCSPYKTQKKLELSEYQVNCLGDSGFSANYNSVLRISVKFSAAVTNANDSSQFQQYCIANVEESFN